MTVVQLEDVWEEFLQHVKTRIRNAEYENWFAPIKVVGTDEKGLILQVPNVFVQEYIISNYKKEIISYFSLSENERIPLNFVIVEPERKSAKKEPVAPKEPQEYVPSETEPKFALRLNDSYRFGHFIEGPANQFVKSAALGIATRPGHTYNPLFIHGGVGLGKTHLLHSIAHHIREHQKRLRVQVITTEAFINDLVDSLRKKSIDRMKHFYRNLDVLLVDDIQFLQNRLNFEEEFCNMFETLINQKKQVVITSDKSPAQLKLSERLVARMEWGLVANIGAPDLETRVAILQYKAERKGFTLPQNIAFFIAEHIFLNVRQLEGAINRLSAYCGLLDCDLTQARVEDILGEMLQYVPQQKITVEQILKSVASMFNVRVSDLRGTSRTKEIAFPRQVAMYLAKELINDSLIRLASSFGGKTHSTLLHSWKKIKEQIEGDETLRRKIQMTKQSIKD